MFRCFIVKETDCQELGGGSGGWGGGWRGGGVAHWTLLQLSRLLNIKAGKRMKKVKQSAIDPFLSLAKNIVPSETLPQQKALLIQHLTHEFCVC